MPKFYKLTDEDNQTYGNCQWGENVTHETNGEGDLCGPGWTHWYTHPLLAVLLNPIHGEFDLETAHLWESSEDQVAEKTDHGLKVGCRIGTTVRQIDLPKVTMNQRVAFGILCALTSYKNPKFIDWANKWLDNEDRTVEAANVAYDIASNAAYTANTADAVNAAIYAASNAAYTANTADAVNAAIYAAYAAAYTAAAAAANTAVNAAAAAAAAANAADAAANAATKSTTNDKLNLIAIAEKAMEYV